MNNIKTLGFFNRHKLAKVRRVIPEYLKHKGLHADEFVFTEKLFKEPEFFVAGFKIATQKEVFNGKERIYYSLIF